MTVTCKESAAQRRIYRGMRTPPTGVHHPLDENSGIKRLIFEYARKYSSTNMTSRCNHVDRVKVDFQSSHEAPRSSLRVHA
jgi:hypothetical protein